MEFREQPTPEPSTPPQTPETPPDEATYNRRDVLKLAAGLGIVAIAGEPVEAAPTQAPIDNLAERMQFESQIQALEFAIPTEPLPKPLADAARAIEAYQQSLNLEKLSDAGLNTATQVAPDQLLSPNRLQELREQLWTKISAPLGITEPFSRERFAKMLTFDVPSKLAPHGIYVNQIELMAIDPQSSQFSLMETGLQFYQLRQIAHETVTRNGKAVQRTIAHVSGPLVVDGKPVNATLPARSGMGKTYHQTIFIFDEAKPKSADQVVPQRLLELAPQILSAPTETLLNKLAGENSKTVWQVAAALGAVKLTAQLSQLPDPIQSDVDNVIEHETGHLLHLTKPSFHQRFAPASTTDARQAILAGANRCVHDEINGFLGELQYSRTVQHPLITIVSEFSQEQSGQDFFHSRALRWTAQQLFAEIAKDPARYGVQINSALTVPVGAQIMLQFDAVAQHADELHALGQLLDQRHDSEAPADFSADYAQFIHLPQPTPPPFPILSPKILSTIAVIAGATAVKGGMEFFRKRSIGLAEDALKQAFKKKRFQSDKLLDDLQLRSKSVSDLDQDRRTSAIKELIRLGQEERYRSAVERIKAIIPKEFEAASASEGQ